MRRSTISLLAASVLLTPDRELILRRLAEADLDWEDVLYLADGHGITPLLYRLWSGMNLLPFVPAPPRARMEQACTDNAARNQDARRELGEIMNLMGRAQVEPLVLKGLPLIRELYEDPAKRVLYDFDLLAKDEVEARRGFEALRSAGFTPVPTKPGAQVNKHLPSVWRLNGFQRRGYLFDVALPRPVELHLTLWDTPWRGLELRPLGDLWPRSRLVDMDGMRVRVLSLEDTCLHLCVHLATHWVEREARLGQVIDLARLMSKWGRELDWTRILDASDRARIRRLVYLALRGVNLLTGAPLPPTEVLDALRRGTPRALRDWVDQHGAQDLLAMDFRKPELNRAYALTFAATQSWGEKARVLRFALLPPLANLQEEYGGGSAWLYARHIGRRGRAFLNSLRNSRQPATRDA